jgi:hypothetical protein
MRIKDFAERLSSAMVLLQKSLLPASGSAGRAAGTQTQTEYSTGLALHNMQFLGV